MLLTCTAANDFQVEAHDVLVAESQAKLKVHTERMEAERRLLGLRGEAIISSLTTSDELWEYGRLVTRNFRGE